MYLTDTQKAEFCEHIANFLTVRETAIIIEVNPDELALEVADLNSEISKLYYREMLINKSYKHETLKIQAKDANETAINELSKIERQLIINELFEL